MAKLAHLLLGTVLLLGACAPASEQSTAPAASDAAAVAERASNDLERVAATNDEPSEGSSAVLGSSGAAELEPGATVVATAAAATRPSYDIALDCVGRDNKLDFPLIASYRLNSREKLWWICFDGGGCTEPRPAQVISSDIIIFEKDEATATVWHRQSGYLTSADLTIDMRRSLQCTRTRAAEGEMLG